MISFRLVRALGSILPFPLSPLDSFRWPLPAKFNMGTACADKHVTLGQGSAIALHCFDPKGSLCSLSFLDLTRISDRLAVGLRAALHTERGNVVGVYMSQGPETVLAHLAIYKLGAIALPLFTQFGSDALKYRLQNSEAKVCIVDAAGLNNILDILPELPNLKYILVCPPGAALGMEEKLDKILPDNCFLWSDVIRNANPSSFFAASTSLDDPALLIYTSGTTGNPKGCLHAHRVLIGHLPGVELPHNMFPQRDDLMYTPADYAWIGGLLDVMLPSLFHGVPLLAYRMKKFDPEECFRLIKNFKVQNAFLPPTALKMMRQVSHPERFGIKMRSIGSGGENLGGELLEWGRMAFGTTINEFYGQTECNLVISNSFQLFPIKYGSMGRQVLGHTVAIVDEKGLVQPDEVVGNIAVKMPDPVAFLGYLNNATATNEKFVGDWLLTGDLGKRDVDGYFYFFGRDDCVIKTSGYRCGPAEIESTILKHASVVLCAVIGKPDTQRGEIIKAFVVLRPEITKEQHDVIRAEIVTLVKTFLAPYEHPREIEFVNELPLTLTGKIIHKELRRIEIAKMTKLQKNLNDL